MASPIRAEAVSVAAVGVAAVGAATTALAPTVAAAVAVGIAIAAFDTFAEDVCGMISRRGEGIVTRLECQTRVCSIRFGTSSDDLVLGGMVEGARATGEQAVEERLPNSVSNRTGAARVVSSGVSYLQVAGAVAEALEVLATAGGEGLGETVGIAVWRVSVARNSRPGQTPDAYLYRRGLLPAICARERRRGAIVSRV